MSKMLTLLAALLLIIAGFLMFRSHNAKEEINDINLKPVQDLNPTAVKTEDSGFHQWHEFDNEASNFKVLLPSLPQHVSDVVEDPKTKELRKYDTFALAGDNGAAFIINAITFGLNQEAEASEELLKSAVDDMIARSKDSKLNNTKMSTFRDQPALDFSLSNGPMLIEGKVFAHNKTMYILSMINNKDTFSKKELEFFINSFDFIDKNKPAPIDNLKKTK